MTGWQKYVTTVVMLIGALLFAYAGIDATKDFGIAWQVTGRVVGAAIGAILGFILCIYIMSNFSSEED
jgi:hypothetical protein